MAILSILLHPQTAVKNQQHLDTFLEAGYRYMLKAGVSADKESKGMSCTAGTNDSRVQQTKQSRGLLCSAGAKNSWVQRTRQSRRLIVGKVEM